jgi:hypothetical protein
VFNHKITLNNLGVICIAIIIKTCLIVGGILCIKKKPLPNFIWKVFDHKGKVPHYGKIFK